MSAHQPPDSESARAQGDGGASPFEPAPQAPAVAPHQAADPGEDPALAPPSRRVSRRRRAPGSRDRGGLWALGRIPLTVNLFTLMLGVTVLVAGVLVTYTVWESRKVAEQTASRLLAEVAAKASQQVAGLVAPAGTLANLGATLPEVDSPPTTATGDALRDVLITALGDAPALYSAFRGFADGQFHQVISLGEQESVIRVAHAAPPGTRFIDRAILGPPGIRSERWTFLDAEGRILGERTNAASYDPRTRPWYQEARQRDGVILSELYVFSSLGLPGVTVARPFARVPDAGVFGVDITLGALSQFLRDQKVSPHARLLVLAADGSVVAAPSLDTAMQGRRVADGNSLGLLMAEDLDDPVAVSLARAVLVYGGAVTRFSEGGEVYLARAAAVKVGGGQRLFVAVAAPLSDFTAVVERMRRNSLAFSGLVLALSVPVIFLISRRASEALKRLAKEAERIQALDLDGPITLRSPVREIHALSQAMAAMKGALATFGLYVPKDLVRRILQSKGAISLGGERREMTILFTDVQDYTRLAETMAPETLMSRTSAYFEQLTQAVMSSGGVVDKFIGDGALCFWNAPLDDPEHPTNACLALLDFRDRLAAFNRALREEGQAPMVTRMGLHLGDCVVGNLGSSDRVNYSAIGTVVNSAARMERVNKLYGTRILVSDAVATRVGADIALRLVDLVAPQACPVPVPIHEPWGVQPDSPLPGGKLDDRTMDWIARWNRALRCLHDPAADSAALRALFVDLAQERPDDGLAQAMVVLMDHWGDKPLPRDLALADWPRPPSLPPGPLAPPDGIAAPSAPKDTDPA